jgi:predicted HicB family RNase H-like nuclease
VPPSVHAAALVAAQAAGKSLNQWADRAMYQAKEAGRNSIQFYDMG